MQNHKKEIREIGDIRLAEFAGIPENEWNENYKGKRAMKKSVNENMSVAKAKKLYKKHFCVYFVHLCYSISPKINNTKLKQRNDVFNDLI